MSAKSLNRICGAMFFLGFLNFISFCFISQRLGGEAIHGKVEDGHYYLATGYVSNGRPRLDTPHEYIEVSSGVFQYSQVHGYSVLVTFPLGLIACVVGSSYGKRLKNEPTNGS